MERIVPREKWLYDDRGMIKWMGWILSDHSAYMEREQEKQRSRSVDAPMAVEAISNNLKQAWEYGLLVTVQTNILENNTYAPELCGHVVGVNRDQIYLQRVGGQMKVLPLAEIRYAKVMAAEKWWLNDNPVG